MPVVCFVLCCSAFAVVVQGCGGAEVNAPTVTPQAQPPSEEDAVAYVQTPVDDDGPFPEQLLSKVESESFYPFWRCALGLSEEELTQHFTVFTRIVRRTQTDAKAFASHLRTQKDCLPLLAQSAAAYRDLKREALVPHRAHEHIDLLANDVERFYWSWRNFTDIIDGVDTRSKLRHQMMEDGKALVGYQSSIQHKVPEKQAHWRPRAVPYYHFISCVLDPIKYTDFETKGEHLAQDDLLAELDEQCEIASDVILPIIELDCSRFLFMSPPPEADEAFETAMNHWVRQDGDYGSAVPIDECLDAAPPHNVKHLAGHFLRILRYYQSDRQLLSE